MANTLAATLARFGPLVGPELRALMSGMGPQDQALLIHTPGCLHWLWLVAPGDRMDGTTVDALAGRALMCEVIGRAQPSAGWYLAECTGRGGRGAPHGTLIQTSARTGLAQITRRRAAMIALGLGRVATATGQD